MGCKVVGFRCPNDLAEEFEQFCEGAGKTTGEVLRKLVDDLIYPGSGRERLKERQEAASLAYPEQSYGVSTTEWIAEQVNTQIKEQLKEQLGDLINDSLELVQIDRGMTEAEKEQLNELVGKMDLLTQRIDKTIEQDNRNIQMVNENSREWSEKVYLLFQALDKHTHSKLTGGATMDSEAAKLIDAEVREADKHRGELPKSEEPNIIEGKTDKPGYKYFENLNLSVKE